jgi:pimeloyl-[acyl-carrier protein] methyl ester esterase
MHIKVMGQGPDLVMLHGWSMHSAVWHKLADQLSQHFTLHLVDLPGHGYSDWRDNGFDLKQLVNDLAEQLPDSAYCLGWSLGGLISIAFSHQYPERVKKLILMAATPCFVKTDDWRHAMDASVFNLFADNLVDNQHDTLQRFLMLQARGAAQSRTTIRQLSEQLAKQAPAQPIALKAGLELLINSDLRQQLTKIKSPTKAILGERDTLIPVAVAESLNELKPNFDISVIEGGGHAPFISHPTECQVAIEQFLND